MFQRAKILLILYSVMVVMIASCSADGVLPTDTQSVSEISSVPPVTAVYLIDKTITFECLNQEGCFPEINLEQIVPIDETCKLGSVYYVNSSRIFVILNSNGIATIVQINPTTKETTPIPIKTDARIRTIAHGKLVIAQDDKVVIIQDDKNIVEVDVGKDIFQVIETTDNRVIAIVQQPIRIDGNTFVETFIIDVDTGEYEQKLVQSPNFDSQTEPTLGVPQDNEPYAGRLFTVDSNLAHTYLYYLYKTADSVQRELGMFKVDPLQSVTTISNPPFIDNLSGYSQQYNNIAYSRIADTDGGGIDTLINLSDLTPLIDTSQIISQEYKKYILFSPFGEYFLLGTGSRIILLSLDGKIVEEYALPADNISQSYRIMEYKK